MESGAGSTRGDSDTSAISPFDSGYKAAALSGGETSHFLGSLVSVGTATSAMTHRQSLPHCCSLVCHKACPPYNGGEEAENIPDHPTPPIPAPGSPLSLPLRPRCLTDSPTRREGAGMVWRFDLKKVGTFNSGCDQLFHFRVPVWSGLSPLLLLGSRSQMVVMPQCGSGARQ